MKYKKKVKMIVLLLCLLVMAVSIYHICTYWQQEQASLQLNDDLMNKVTKSTDRVDKNNNGTMKSTV